MSEVNDGITIPVERGVPLNSANMPSNEKYFSEEEVTKIRQQEKDKLYKRLEDSESRYKQMEDQLNVLAKEREDAIRLAEDRAKKEADVLRQREIEELTAKELLARTEDQFKQRLNQVEQEWSVKFQEMEQQRMAQEAVLEKERALQALESYRSRRMAEEQEAIIPELLDLISGNSQEDIENSIGALRARSSAIIESIQQAAQPNRLRGAQVTAPPVGPLDNQMEYQSFSADDIRNMPMDQYAKMRDRLLNARPNSRGRF
jgi:hypothetical protein